MQVWTARRITQNTLYRLFIIEGLAARIDAINRVLSERLNEEKDLPAKGGKLASLYLAFFTEVERYAGYTEALLKEIAVELEGRETKLAEVKIGDQVN